MTIMIVKLKKKKWGKIGKPRIIKNYKLKIQQKRSEHLPHKNYSEKMAVQIITLKGFKHGGIKNV